MADKTNPSANGSKTSEFLPRIYRSDANKKFLQATTDQLVQNGTVNKINGYVGRQNSKATVGSDIFIKAPNLDRQNYQLEPGITVKDELGKVSFFKDYQDYINQLTVFGANTSKHSKINNQEFYSWDPHINWDKFINFQQYYWLPYGPDVIKIAGQQEKIISEFDVRIEDQGDSFSFVLTPDGLTRNPTIKLFKGQTYTFKVNSPGNPFSIKTSRTSGSLDRYVKGITNNGVTDGLLTFEVPYDAPDVLYYLSENDLDLGGVFQLNSIDENTYINVETEILGKVNYTLADGTPLSNGMKVSFYGRVEPAEYASGQFYVEGVGSSIKLVNESTLELISAYTLSESVLFDDTPFDSLPFSDATSYAKDPDYVVINRSSQDHNPWSRYNRWFHKDVIEASASFNGKVPDIDQSARAVRPIIEFDADIKLYNFGRVAVADVDLVDTFTTDVFSTIEGSLGYNIDGQPVTQGQRILFTADTDILVKNKIYRVDFIDVRHTTENGQLSRQIHLIPESEPVLDQVVLVKQGTANQGLMYWFNGDEWKITQQKTKRNQAPLFDIVDSNGVSYSDTSVYDGSSFAGTTIFSYKVGSGTADSNLGFALSYKNINNIGDIVFNFSLATDEFQYKDISTIITKSIAAGYLVKTESVDAVAYLNGWQTSTVSNSQAGIRIYKDSNKVNNFDVDVFDDVNDLADLEVRVYVNGIRLDKNKWQVVDGPAYKKIVLATDITTNDVLTIKTFASQPINSNGYYEIPINLQHNPLNELINEFTLGEVSDHVNSIIDNIQSQFSGVFPGSNNLRDLGNVTQYGTKFVQHSGPASLSLYHITSDKNNVIKAIEQSKDDYNKFKRNFLNVAETLGVDTATVEHVNLILAEINKDKPKTSPYYFSDMVGYTAKLTNDYTVIDYRIKKYPLSSTFDLTTLSNKAVYVYLNGTQLIHGKDYTFDGLGFVEILATLANGNVIRIYEYDNTDGCFVPQTPTKLGLWPKYEPMIYEDTSLITPRTMIQGHDGSQVLAYGDFRDDLIIELEKRIFNNIKVEYDPTIFDITDIVPGYNRTTDFSLTEFNQVLAPQFYKWTSLIDRDFTKPLSFDRTNSMSFNYRGHVAPDGREVPGYWRGVYRWMLDTDRPNICPWEMLGFTIEPKWWQQVYGPAPYTRDNLILWQDLSEGIVREPNRPVIRLEKYARPFLINCIPVDSNGNIISPLLSNMANGVITPSTNGDFVFGDVSPIEGSWRRSSHYPFAVIITMMLLQPSKVFGVLLDRSRVVRDVTGQLVYKDTGLRIKSSDVVFPSIYSSSTRVQTSGIINYIADYIVSDNLKSFASYEYDMDNLSAQISYRVGGFTSKEKFNLLLDSKSPTATAGVFIPQEDYEIILNSSSPVKKITYSGVIVTKLEDGFEVKGYSKTQPYFNYYGWTQDGRVVNVGGISESFSTWTPGEQYAAGKIVQYGNKYFRVKVLHVATSFDASKYQSLPALPIIGGRDAYFRTGWDRTEVLVVPYGTKFRTIQEVVDFLLGYGEYLKGQGFIFDDFNNNLSVVTNWETSAKEFMFWTTQNWSSGQDKWQEWLPDNVTNFGEIVRYNGDYYRAIRKSEASSIFVEDDFVKLDGLNTVGSSVISLSPSAAKVTFTAPISVVDDIRNSFNGYEIFKVDGTPIVPNFLNSYRDGNEVSYAPQASDGIYGASFYLVQKEQVVILNNTTMFNDTIYNPASGYKQDRIKVAGYVTTNWHGAFDAPGFIFDQANISDWESWKDYALGDIVKYKEFYYTANAFIPGKEVFTSADWYRLEEKPTAQLIPNWSYKAGQFTDFYSLDSDNFDAGQQKMAQHLIGYQKRQYLSNIIKDDVSEFKFYQGMIIEKGTQNSLNKLFDVLSADGEDSINFYEEWAIRVGQYGANAAFENIEFVLDEAEFKSNPQAFELVNIVDRTKVDFVYRQTPTDVYVKPIGYNNSPWPTVTNYQPFLRSPGYVRPDEVKLVVDYIDSLPSKSNAGFTTGDYIWVGFDGPSWNIYRYTPANLGIVDVTYDKPSKELTIITSKLIDLEVGSFIGISQTSLIDGFYKIKSVTLNKLVVEADIAGWSAPFTEQLIMLVFALTSQRVSSIDQANTALPRELLENELLWTDDDGTGKWATWKYNSVFSNSILKNTLPAEGLGYGRSINLSNNGNIIGVSTALGEIVIYDKTPGPNAPWIQRQTIVKPFVAKDGAFGVNPNQDAWLSEVVAASADGRWLAVGSPRAGNACVTSTSNVRLNQVDSSGTNLTITAHGVVSLYEKDKNNIYSLVTTFLSPTPVANERFGSSLAFGNDTLFIGAEGFETNKGIVYQVNYEDIIEATAYYNPNGSLNNVIVVSSTTGIEPGMVVRGTGFDGNQIVGSVVNSTKLILNQAPVSTPDGLLEFITTSWGYDDNIINSPAGATGNFGNLISVSLETNRLLISAPNTTSAGKVYVYDLAESTSPVQTLTGTDLYFGQSVAISQSGKYIAVSSILADDSKLDQGKVYVYEYNISQYGSFVNGTFVAGTPVQTLTSPRPETAGYFGKKLSFINDYETLVVYSENADSTSAVTFDNSTTTFDANVTEFKATTVDSGQIDIFDRYASQWIYSETLTNPTEAGSGYGTGFATAGNYIVVGAPYVVDNTFVSGKVYEYRKPVGKKSWNIIHREIDKPDLSKVKKAFLYNRVSNKIVTYLDVLDPVQGHIPGIADQEVKFKTFYDPAVYSYGDDTVNVDSGIAWNKKQVGMLWWDLRTAKFINTYDSDILYRNSNWNSLFPNASIDIYEWVETNLKPDAWNAIADSEEGVAKGISGTSLYGSNVYSETKRYDNISKTYKYTYYFWVKNKKTIPSVGDRKMSAETVAALIENPRGEGYKYLALTSANSFSLVNVKPLLEDKDVVLSVEYWINEVSEQNIHSEWKLVSNNQSTTIPKSIEQKWFDSLCGKDLEGRVVPDPVLPPKLSYGVENRPRQGMFVNRFEALKQFVERVNLSLIKHNVVNTRSLDNLDAYEVQPGESSGLYDTVLDTELELRFANVGSFVRPSLTPIVTDGAITGATIDTRGNGYLLPPAITVVGSGKGAVVKSVINTKGQITGIEVIAKGSGYDSNTIFVVRDYSVLVRSDSQANGLWSIYSYDVNTLTWSRIRAQSYDARNYWSYVDWYETGYSQFTTIDHAVNTFVELNNITPSVGNIVKVRTTNTGNWLLLEKYADVDSIDWTQQYRVVGSQNGTIQLNQTLYSFTNTTYGYDGALYDGSMFDNSASQELRIILNALKDDILIDDLKTEYLNLFFTSIRYVLSEQTFVDWIFKTSFVKAQHNTGALRQLVNYNNDNLSDYESYINEVKPYRTKVREYVSSYTNLDTGEMAVSDFDLMPIYQNKTTLPITTSIVDGQVVADSDLIDTYPWKHWKDNLGFIVTELVLVDGGSGYANPPAVRIVSDTGTGATGRAFISNGKVNRIVLLTKGTGYLSAPTVIIEGGLGSSGGTDARAVAIIGDSVIRSNLIKMKFDRITQTYFITQLEETETFVGTGSRLQWPLTWAPDTRFGKSKVTINGVEVLRDSYKLSIVRSTTRGYTSYSGSILFSTAIADEAVVSVTYIKDWSLLNAADRIQYYYDPVSGELGKDLSQLMTGVDYGGVVVSGLDFGVSAGWGTLPYYSDKWDSFDPTFDDYIVTVAADTHDFELPYVPSQGTEINVYHVKYDVTEHTITDSETTYTYNLLQVNPVASVSKSTTALSNTKGGFVLSVASTVGVRIGDVVTSAVTNMFGYNTLVTEIINSTSVKLDQIIFENITSGEDITFTRQLVVPTDCTIYGNGTVVLTEAPAIGSVLTVSSLLRPVRIDGTDNVMDTWIADGVLSAITVPSEFVVGDKDQFIFRKSTSDGSIKPQETDYDTAVSGGDLAYSSATGLAADDILLDGDGFVTPTSSPATEEVVPGQVVDAVAIKVFDRPSSGSANLKVDNYISTGTTAEFKVTQQPNSKQAIIVKVGEDILYDLVDYEFDYRNSLVTLTDTPPAGEVVSIFSFGFAGSNILDLDYYVADGSTTEFITKAPWIEEFNGLVYVDGVQTSAEFFKTDNSYDSALRIGLRFTTAPVAGALINFVVVSGSDQTFSIAKTERFTVTSSLTYNLSNNYGSALPIESNLIVKVGQEVLDSPNDTHFTIGSNRLTYAIDPKKFVGYTVDIGDIAVIANGNLLRPVLDYTVELGGINIKINRTIYRTYTGKQLVVSIRKNSGYLFVPATDVTPAQIILKESKTVGSTLEVTSFYKHDILDVQRGGYTVTNNIAFTPDTVEYYEYTGLTAGRIKLERAVLNDYYVVITRNNQLLTPGVDFKLTQDRKTVKLAVLPDINDVISIITYGSNVLTSGIAYMQFKDMLNRVHFKRLSLNKQTELVRPLRYNDTSFEVVDASTFDLPNPAKNRPGVVEIRGERIEYFSIEGNVLSQLRRGTLGTGTPSVHPINSKVQDIGPSETVPYTETSMIEQVVSDGTNVINLKFVPMLSVIESGHAVTTVSDWTDEGYETSMPDNYIQADDIEVFVGGYDISLDWASGVSYNEGDIVNLGSYTYKCVTTHTSSTVFKDDSANWVFFIGNIRLKKKPYLVHNINQHPESPEGDLELDADFAVDGESSAIRLTTPLKFGTKVTVIKRQGFEWDSTVNIQQETTKIAKFLTATPGIWYAEFKNTENTEYGTFDGDQTSFDNANITFDRG